MNPKNVVIIGARSVDPDERRLIKEQGVKVFTMHEIDRYGMTVVMEDALAYLRSREVDGVHLSLDLDGLDPPVYTRSWNASAGWNQLSRKPSCNGNARRLRHDYFS